MVQDRVVPQAIACLKLGPSGLGPSASANESLRRHHCQEHERARDNVRNVWAPTRELAFVRYSLQRGWKLVRETRRWYWAGSGWKYDEAKQVSSETHSDPDWHPQCRRKRICREVVDEQGSSRRSSCGEFGKGDKGRNHLKHTASGYTTELVQRASVRACRCLSSVAGTCRLCSES